MIHIHSNWSKWLLSINWSNVSDIGYFFTTDYNIISPVVKIFSHRLFLNAEGFELILALHVTLHRQTG